MITSAANPTLKLVRKLLAQKRKREELGLFVAEGEDLVDAARDAGIEPTELLVAGETVAPELLAELSTLAHPARVVGVFRTQDLPSEQREVTLALWQVGDPGNVGTLLRTADAFGAAVALSAGCADPLAPKALRASAGAVFRVPLVGFDEARGRRIALVAHGGAPLREVDLGWAGGLPARRRAGGTAGGAGRRERPARDDRASRCRGVAQRGRGGGRRALRATLSPGLKIPPVLSVVTDVSY